MTDPFLDVVGIGNAIVDVLSQADETFLVAQDLAKGSMTLIDGARAEELYAAMGPGVEMSGGSAANTMAGLASLGGQGAFIGKVRNDQLGGIFQHDIRAAGVAFHTPVATDGPPTARCLIFVTPDAQRTMNTFLGAAVELGPEDLDEAVIGRAKVTYLEGYLWDAPAAKAAFQAAARMAHDAGRKVSLTLSDSFCVERHRDSFIELIGGHIDILFANEVEICSLFQVADFDRALQEIRDHCEIAALTRSAKGSVILANGEVHVVDAAPVDKVVDTTGAGDLYAAGFLHGYTQGKGFYDCGRIGALAAAEVLSHYGARPETSLEDLVAQQLGAG
ncbi:MAG: adenosine kinase [Alphaproteobacteria bacterium]